MGRSPKISPKVQSGDKSHPASIISGVIQKVSTPIPKLRKLIIALIVSFTGSFVSVGGVVAGAGVTPPVGGVPVVAGAPPAATTTSTPLPPISTPPLPTRKSPTDTKSPAQKRERRVRRESLERVVESDICVLCISS